jgi:hypothetical protein
VLVVKHLVDSYRELHSVKAVGDLHGCSPTTVSKYVRLAGVDLDGHRQRRLPIGTPPKWSRRIASNGYAVWYGWVQGENRYDVLAEHRLLMEEAIGRPLERWEHVHHRNGIRDDNRLENLELKTLWNHRPGASHCPHCGGEL